MIVVRDIFQLKFGKAKDALTLWRDGVKILGQNGFKPDRILTDITGQYYTLIMESSFKSLTDYENLESSHSSSDEWWHWYQKFVPLVESGRREIFRTVE